MPNHYQVLQLAPDATQEQIRISYHRLARDLHPDRRHRRQQERTTAADDVTTPPDASCASATDDLVRSSSLHEHRVGGMSSKPNVPEIPGARRISGNHEQNNNDGEDTDERFRKVQDAYLCLYDASKRREYDETLRLQENRRKSRRRSAIALQISDCRWVDATTIEGEGCDVGDNNKVSNHHRENPMTLNGHEESDGATVLVYTCRCGEELYPLEEIELGELDDWLLDCPGCSAVYDVSTLV